MCRSHERMGRQTKAVYGKPLCKRCWSRFASRRQAAYAVDIFLHVLVMMVLSVPATMLVALTGVLELPIGSFYVFGSALFVVKDGLFTGRSPGKAAFGLRVVDRDTGRPASLRASVKRNLPTLIPYFPLVIGWLLRKGTRPGDKWANTRVVWERYHGSPVFSFDTAPAFAAAPALTTPAHGWGVPGTVPPPPRP